MEGFLSLEQAAEQLQFSVSELSRQIEEGRVVAIVKEGRSWLSAGEVSRLKRQSERASQPPTSDPPEELRLLRRSTSEGSKASPLPPPAITEKPLLSFAPAEPLLKPGLPIVPASEPLLKPSLPIVPASEPLLKPSLPIVPSPDPILKPSLPSVSDPLVKLPGSPISMSASESASLLFPLEPEDDVAEPPSRALSEPGPPTNSASPVLVAEAPAMPTPVPSSPPAAPTPVPSSPPAAPTPVPPSPPAAPTPVPPSPPAAPAPVPPSPPPKPIPPAAPPSRPVVKPTLQPPPPPPAPSDDKSAQQIRELNKRCAELEIRNLELESTCNRLKSGLQETEATLKRNRAARSNLENDVIGLQDQLSKAKARNEALEREIQHLGAELERTEDNHTSEIRRLRSNKGDRSGDDGSSMATSQGQQASAEYEILRNQMSEKDRLLAQEYEQRATLRSQLEDKQQKYFELKARYDKEKSEWSELLAQALQNQVDQRQQLEEMKARNPKGWNPFRREK